MKKEYHVEVEHSVIYAMAVFAESQEEAKEMAICQVMQEDDDIIEVSIDFNVTECFENYTVQIDEETEEIEE